MNPDDFIITRKRKKYKFAKFYNASNCYELDQWTKAAVDVVEIGAGTGLFSVELARRHPDKAYVAIDVKADRLQKGAYEALDLGVSNVSFVRARADQIGELFEPGSIEQIWLTFSDPYPRERSAGRRLAHPTFLAKYHELLKSGGHLVIKHDNPEFFAWSLEQLIATGWHVVERSYDLHASDLDDDYHVMTSYEQRWLAEGRIVYCAIAEKSNLYSFL